MGERRFDNNNFDLVRLLAALQVLLIHGMTHFGVGLSSRTAQVISALPGVPVFFVVSGFLVSASWERRTSAAQYARNRCLRIFPALWVCFAFTVAVLLPLHRPAIDAGEFLVWAAAQLSVVQFYNPAPLREFHAGVANGSLWTIPVELQFYAVLPLLAWMRRRLSWPLVLALLVGLFVANQAILRVGVADETLATKVAKVSLLPYLSMFFLGMLLQQRFDLVQKYLAGRAHWFALAYAGACWALGRAGLDVTGNAMNPLSSVLLALLVVSFAYTAPGRLAAVLKGNDVSYGLYIYHMVWINVLLGLALLAPWQNMVAMAVLAVASAWLSWRCIERPALGLKHGGAHGMHARPAAAEPR